ncbi:MAG: hypothetical protein A2096_07000 [Spirochaetes bacterium GWF1_41_5]|nr:MAG: hypothetical protein A2096_07000 [Spirochaetes bacterium GWF1_41_5]HBE03361.1 hypothetical protein [Spirochaetia bacterium]
MFKVLYKAALISALLSLAPGFPQMSIPERIKKMDQNSDGQVTRQEFNGPPAIFQNCDTDNDGVLSAREIADAQALPAKNTNTQNKETTGEFSMTPLTEMTKDDKYKGEDGGLYGQGQNEPPADHLQAAIAESKKIIPLDENGKPQNSGKVCLVSIGMSNTTQEFNAFIRLLEGLKNLLSRFLAVVDGATGGQEVYAWAKDVPIPKFANKTPWDLLADRLTDRDISALQVQAAWVKVARKQPAAEGEYPAHAQKFSEYFIELVQKLRTRYPNLRIAYCSSRIYAGYAATALSPEPYAFENALAIRSVILRQISGDTALNWDPARGPVKAPLLLWGPYLWANGKNPRQADNLVWLPEDFMKDGTHPSPESGVTKVANILLDFFKTNPSARDWFLQKD